MKDLFTLPIDRSVSSFGGSPVYQFGCGRFILTESTIPCEGIRTEAGREILRHGKSPLIIGGPTALSLTEDALRDSMSAAGIEGNFKSYSGHCSVTGAQSLLTGLSCDVIVGIGGGRTDLPFAG